MTQYILTNKISSAAATVTVTPGDDVYVAAGVYVINEDQAEGATAILGSADCSAQIDGAVSGYNGVIFTSGANLFSSIEIGATGSVSTSPNPIIKNGALLGFLQGTGAVTIENGGYSVDNLGAIDGDETDGVDLDFDESDDTAGASDGGLTINRGSIEAVSNHGVYCDNTSAVTNILENYGAIDSYLGVHYASGSGQTNILDNWGTIASQDDDVVGENVINNHGTILSTNADAIFGMINCDLDNSGDISGEVSLGENSAVLDSGKIDGALLLIGTTGANVTDVTVLASGVISGSPTRGALTILGGAYDIVNDGEITASLDGVTSGVADGVTLDGAGTIVNRGTISASDGDGIVNTAPEETVSYLYNHGDLSSGLTSSGTFDTILDTGGHIDVIFNYGAIDAGSEGAAIFTDSTSRDSIYNFGEISGVIELGAEDSGIVNRGEILGGAALEGGDSRVVNRGAIDGDIVFGGTLNVFNGVGGTVNGTIFGAGGTSRYFSGADNETFNFTASGAGLAVGGAGSDTFIFDVAGLTSATTIRGAAGATDDVLQFANAGTISQAAFTHVSGIETIALANGANNLTITNAMLASATGNAMTINGGTGADTINAGGVTVASDQLTIYGGGGGDVITAGGTDTFLYKAAADSTGPTYDTINGLNFAQASFDVPGGIGSILAINPAVTTGSLSTATFNSDLAADLPAATLGAHDALMFTPNAGTLSGDTFLVVDLNGVAGYTANADLVVRLNSATGTLTTGNFV